MELKKTCNFMDALKDCGPVPGSLSSLHRPKTQVGYYRADYDGHQWWTQYFNIHDTLKTETLMKESRGILGDLLTGFPNLTEIKRFCKVGNAEKISDVEYNCYVNGTYGNYWIRFITLEKNYNIYCHILWKESVD